MYGSIGPSDTSCVVGKHEVASSSRGHHSHNSLHRQKQTQGKSRKIFGKSAKNIANFAK